MRRAALLSLLSCLPSAAHAVCDVQPIAKGLYQSHPEVPVSQKITFGDANWWTDQLAGAGVSIASCGAVSGQDSTAAIQDAINAVHAAGGGTVLIPAGTFLVLPSGSTSFLRMYSNVAVRGVGPASVLKIADATGDYQQLFGCVGSIANVAFRDFRIDQNPTGNASANIVNGSTTASQYAIALWSVSGLTVSGVRFDPAAGVNTVTAGNNGLLAADLSGNFVRFVKGHTTAAAGFYDNSAFYLEGTGQTIRGNVFDTTLADDALSAIETHGGRSVVSGNVATNFATLVNVVSSQGSYTELVPNDIVVTGNTATGAEQAVSLWAITSRPLRNVLVSDNVLHVANADRASHLHSTALYAGVRAAYIDNLNGDYDGLAITGNVITFQRESRDYGSGTAYTGGIVLRPKGSLANVRIAGNVVKDSPAQGIAVGSATDLGTSSASRIVVEDNSIIDAGQNATATLSYRAGIFLQHDMATMTVRGNILADSGPSAMNGYYGIYLSVSAGTDHIVGGNIFRAAAGSFLNHTEAPFRFAYEPIQAYSVAGGASLYVDAMQYRFVDLTVAHGSAWGFQTFVNGMPGEVIGIRVHNTSGGALGAITWPANVKSTWASPATGKNRTLWLRYDATDTWIESGQTGDVPN